MHLQEVSYHPVHILNNKGELSASSFIPFCSFGNYLIGEKKKEFDIPVIENLKGVGKNLQDHHEVPVISRVKPGYSYFKQDQGWRMIKNGIQYLLFNSGHLKKMINAFKAILKI